MPKRPRAEVTRTEAYEIHVIGGPAPGLHDLYHALLRVPWWIAFTAIVAGYLALNAVFAVAYVIFGGVAGATPGSFADAFFFSVQTMGTVGYGAMYPLSRVANVLVVAESVMSLVITALATGLMFARFSRVRARVAFSQKVAIAPIDGVPTLMIRVGNERRDRIVDATFRLTLVRTTRTREGVMLYRTQELPLVRERASALARAWMVSHQLSPASPLAAETPESLARCDAELTLAVSGMDETSMQAVVAQKTWYAGGVAWGARLADILTETDDGNTVVDLRRFHDLVASEPTADFPYPAAEASLLAASSAS